MNERPFGFSRAWGLKDASHDPTEDVEFELVDDGPADLTFGQHILEGHASTDPERWLATATELDTVLGMIQRMCEWCTCAPDMVMLKPYVYWLCAGCRNFFAELEAGQAEVATLAG